MLMNVSKDTLLKYKQLKESKTSACAALGQALLSFGEKFSADDFRKMAEAFNHLAESTEELAKALNEQSNTTDKVEGE